MQKFGGDGMLINLIKHDQLKITVVVTIPGG